MRLCACAGEREFHFVTFKWSGRSPARPGGATQLLVCPGRCAASAGKGEGALRGGKSPSSFPRRAGPGVYARAPRLVSGSGVRPPCLRSRGDRVAGRTGSVPGPLRPRTPLPAPRLVALRDFPIQGSNFSLLWLIPFSSHPLSGDWSAGIDRPAYPGDLSPGALSSLSEICEAGLGPLSPVPQGR